MNDKSKRPSKEEVDEWMKLVHESACCSYDQTLDEDKENFLRRLDEVNHKIKKTSPPCRE